LTLLSVVDGQEKSVGLILREAREAQGLCLEDVAKVTRIGKAYLTALETEMFDKLPSAAYVKGFLRVYAAYLGLSEQEIIALYEQKIAGHNCETDKQLSEPVPEPIWREKLTAVIGDKRWKEKLAAVTGDKRLYLFVAVVIVVVAAFYLLQNAAGIKATGKGATAPLPVNKNSQTITTPQPPPAPPQTDTIKQDTADDVKEMKNREVANAGSPSPKGIVLKIKVIEDGRLDITIDDTITQHYDLKSGDLFEWKGEKVFVLDVSNAGGIEAELNGKAQKPFGGMGEYAHVSLKAEDK